MTDSLYSMDPLTAMIGEGVFEENKQDRPHFRRYKITIDDEDDGVLFSSSTPYKKK